MRTKVRLFTPVYESPAPIMYLCIELTPKSDVDVQKKKKVPPSSFTFLFSITKRPSPEEGVRAGGLGKGEEGWGCGWVRGGWCKRRPERSCQSE